MLLESSRSDTFIREVINDIWVSPNKCKDYDTIGVIRSKSRTYQGFEVSFVRWTQKLLRNEPCLSALSAISALVTFIGIQNVKIEIANTQMFGCMDQEGDDDLLCVGQGEAPSSFETGFRLSLFLSPPEFLLHRSSEYIQSFLDSFVSKTSFHEPIHLHIENINTMYSSKPPPDDSLKKPN